jgi:hypothetical protein
MFYPGEGGRTHVQHDRDVRELARAARGLGDGREPQGEGDTGTHDAPVLECLMPRAPDRVAALEQAPAPRLEPDGGSQQPGLIAADVALLHASYDTQRVDLTSHRSILGPVIVLAKRIVRQLLTPVLARQVAYNAANARVTSYLAEGAGVLELLEMRLRDEIAAREALATYVHGETITRETFEKHARDETTARQTLERHVRGETAARETLARHLRGETAAREALARDLRGEATARQTLEAHVCAETAARETLATTLREEAREMSAARRALADRVALAERKLRRLFLRLAADVGGVTPPGPVSSPASPPNANTMPPAFDYVGFEDRFRGEEQEIKDRQRKHLTLATGLHSATTCRPVCRSQLRACHAIKFDGGGRGIRTPKGLRP